MKDYCSKYITNQIEKILESKKKDVEYGKLFMKKMYEKKKNEDINKNINKNNDEIDKYCDKYLSQSIINKVLNSIDLGNVESCKKGVNDINNILKNNYNIINTYNCPKCNKAFANNNMYNKHVSKKNSCVKSYDVSNFKPYKNSGSFKKYIYTTSGKLNTYATYVNNSANFCADFDGDEMSMYIPTQYIDYIDNDDIENNPSKYTFEVEI